MLADELANLLLDEDGPSNGARSDSRQDGFAGVEVPAVGRPTTANPVVGPPTAARPVAAAVLVALFEQEGELHIVLTRRRADLRRHAGEVSFPGGRHDPSDADLRETALREAEEEVGLAREEVTLLGALERASTFATNYAIHPFVGLFAGERRWRLSPLEVDAVLEPSLREVREGRTRTRLERRGFTFETDAYIFDGQLVWGATARILENLFDRIGPLLDRPALG
jgi:8-oxo-dGTP pyrophosphatase MutT (NUDIX family)